MDVELSKDARRLLKLLYAEFKRRRSSGMDKADAKSFGSAEQIQSTLALSESVEWLEDACGELDECDMLSVLYADDTVWESVLESRAITYMENRVKRAAREVVDTIGKLKP